MSIFSQLESDLAAARAENEEQARLLGMSGSREAKLLAELADAKSEIIRLGCNCSRTYTCVSHTLKSENKRLRAALEQVQWQSLIGNVVKIAKSALNGGKP